MARDKKTRLPEVFERHEKDLFNSWIERLLKVTTTRRDLIDETELREQVRQLLRQLRESSRAAGIDIEHPAWEPVRALLSEVSQSRARQGFTPSETAAFVFSLKEPLFETLRRELGGDAPGLAEETWTATLLLDRLGLYTIEVFQRGREDVISRQQHDMLELSTPVVQLWEGILGLPLIGTLDSARTQVVMENLLQRLVETGARMAIIDITGVPTVDTLVAQHLLKTVAAARLMGADCIISGIRPQIAQTIVHLGLDLNTVPTKATMADAFATALARVGLAVVRATPRG
jgi:rsbT co-antagonist protein RsbR